MLSRMKTWAGQLKRNSHAIYFAARDPRTPWYARGLAAAVAAYALSPIDLIPDFIPVLGYLDDVIIVPFGILLAVRLVPPEIMAEHRAAAAAALDRPVSRMAGIVIAGIWFAAAGICGWLVYRHFVR